MKRGGSADFKTVVELSAVTQMASLIFFTNIQE
jgi:hypothetical protein